MFPSKFLTTLVLCLLLSIPFILTAWNLFVSIRFLRKRIRRNHHKIIEIIAMVIGLIYTIIYMCLSDIRYVSWDIPIFNPEDYFMISPEHMATFCTIAAVSFVGYLCIRLIPVGKQAPLFSAICISALYMGIALCIIWCIQTIGEFFFLLPALNIIIIYLRTICIFVYEKNNQIQTSTVPTKFKKLSDLLNTATNLPLLAGLLVAPLLGVIIIILMLFGQEPASVIKMWTETAEWTLSQRVPPPRVEPNGHYLCTVAASGHKKVVKPLRTGVRHGQTIIINRQLCVANAFEQLLQEKTPRFHKLVRKLYDNTGYPISKHIHSKYAADVIYLLMKPFELVFLAVLYFVDTAPEDRIAVQYPHKES